eukprot:maker-scaffold193_size270907-snap-gene-0.13 protein:Tk01087 transcript:maker-scaffold193_size270907-snap-gene-0.13-mRNA-1 annotation:"hydroxymethylglutaryl- synthase 1"
MSSVVNGTHDWPKDVGIINMEIYFPSAYVDQTELESFDGVSPGKYTIGLGQTRMGFCSDNEDVNSLCLTACYQLFCHKALNQKNLPCDLSTFDAVLFHTPFCKLVQKSMARLALNDFVKTAKDERLAKFPGMDKFVDVELEKSYFDKEVEKAFMTFSKDLFETKTKPSLNVATNVGNMYTPSLYGGLVSYLCSVAPEDLAGKRVALFSYGSGFVSSFFSLRISSDTSPMSPLSMLKRSLNDVQSRLESRTKVPPANFETIMHLRESVHHKAPYTPSATTEDLFPGTWYLTSVDEKHRRHYDLAQPMQNAVTTPRLKDDTSVPSSNAKAVQVALNDVARSITGAKCQDHVRIPDLLAKAGIPSLNSIAVRAVAMEAWKAYHSCDGPNGTRNPIGNLLFSNNCERGTRAATGGAIPLPLISKADTFVWHATTIWNGSKDLREAPTKGAAMKVAKNLAKTAPI